MSESIAFVRNDLSFAALRRKISLKRDMLVTNKQENERSEKSLSMSISGSVRDMLSGNGTSSKRTTYISSKKIAIAGANNSALSTLNASSPSNLRSDTKSVDIVSCDKCCV